MKKFKISSLLVGTFLVPVVSYGSADFDGVNGQFAGVVVSDATLFEAIKANDIAKVRYLLDHGANVNALKKITDNNPWWYQHSTPLTEAIWTKNIDMVRLLLERGANVNARLEYMEQGREGWILFTRYSCPLVRAIWRRNIEMMRLLLEWGANVNTEGGATYVPLIAAVNAQNPDIVRLLLEQKGIDVNATHNINLSWDEYESRGYAGEPYDIQVPTTALRAAGNNAQIAQLLRAYGAR
jgi:ankyrin repeat protein